MTDHFTDALEKTLEHLINLDSLYNLLNVSFLWVIVRMVTDLPDPS